MKNRRTFFGIIGLGMLVGIVLLSTPPQQAAGDGNKSDSLSDQTELLDEINHSLKRIQKYIFEKESGNMAFMGQGLEQAEVCVWDNESQRWYTQYLSGKGQKIFESNGNFCAYAQVGTKIHFAAWNKFTKRWSPLVRHASMIDIVPCDGNFGYYTTNQDAGIWSSKTDSWNNRRITGTYIISAGADLPPRYEHPTDPSATKNN